LPDQRTRVTQEARHAHPQAPVVPDLDQLKHQAKDLLRAMHAGDAGAVADLREFHPDAIEPGATKLADAQLAVSEDRPTR
jgi:hypothetical protein